MELFEFLSVLYNTIQSVQTWSTYPLTLSYGELAWWSFLVLRQEIGWQDFVN